jgi:hypothetical protein
MEPSDVAACAQFFKDTNGYVGEGGIRESLGPSAWVATSKSGEMLEVSSGFFYTCLKWKAIAENCVFVTKVPF